MNESGVIVGDGPYGSKNRAFIWSPTLGGQWLSTIDDPAIFDTRATSVNDAGQIAGVTHASSVDGLYGDFALRWDAATPSAHQVLLSTSTDDSRATVMGYGGTAYGTSHPNRNIMSWPAGQAEGIPIDVPIAGTHQYDMVDISRGNVLLGEYDTFDGVYKAFTFDLATNTAITLTPGITYDQAYPQDISPNGRYIAGYTSYRPPGGANSAVAGRWTDGTYELLPSLLPASQTINVLDFGVNDAGYVVGSIMDTDFNFHAVLWLPDGTPVDLNTYLPESSGWILTEVYKINNAGQITGQGLQLVNGQWVDRAFFLSPTSALPDPTRAAALITFRAAALTRRRRR